MAATKRHIIIGSGSAALSALERIRSITGEDEIKVITKDTFLPYSPTALPHLLSGRIREADMVMRDEGYFQDMGCACLKGKEVSRIVPERKEIIFGDEEKERYDTLLIATGSRPVSPAIKGLDAVGFISFHTIEDCRRLQSELDRMDRKGKVAILGAGLVGMEIATALLEAGYGVQIIEKEKRILPLYFDSEVEVDIRGICQAKGAQLFTSKEVTEARRNNGKIEVGFKGGSLEADILITAVGVKANTNLVANTNIRLRNGILVDSRMKTSVEDIYAAGDVAETPSFFTNELGMNPILPEAVTQGKIAGTNMAGGDNNYEYEGWIPMNLFNFFGNVALSVGLSQPESNDYLILKHHDDNKKQFKKLIFKGDLLVGAVFLNIDVSPGIIHYLIKRRVDVHSYQELLLEKPKEISYMLMLQTERKEGFLSRG
jgi:phenylglyoxylate dehydrogenase epsilon subunit